MTPSAEPATLEGLDREIEILRGMIRSAGAMQSTELTLEEQLNLLNSVGRTAPALARLLKARRDLVNQEYDPAALLRQALLELEEEWPELKALAQQFRPKKEANAAIQPAGGVAQE